MPAATAGTYADNFGSGVLRQQQRHGRLRRTGPKTNDETTSADWRATSIDRRRPSQFNEGIDGGEIIQRSLNLTGATAATLSFTYEDDNLGRRSRASPSRRGTAPPTPGRRSAPLGTRQPRPTAPSRAADGRPDRPNSAIRFRARDGNWDNGDNFYIDNLAVNATVPGLNAGADTVNGDAGDDTIIWNANAAAPTDGRDIVNGGTEGAAGDTFVITGNATSETYSIYTLAAWDAVAGNDLSSFGGRTPEIVITRNGTGFRQCHRRTERDRGNPHQRRRSFGNRRGRGSRRHLRVIGDFSGTSLRLNTITIDGDAGDDTIDISALSFGPPHRLQSNGGNDTIIGTLRPQDVIELPAGATAADYTTSTANGVTTMTNGDHSITYTAAGDGPQVGPDATSRGLAK